MIADGSLDLTQFGYGIAKRTRTDDAFLEWRDLVQPQARMPREFPHDPRANNRQGFPREGHAQVG